MGERGEAGQNRYDSCAFHVYSSPPQQPPPPHQLQQPQHSEQWKVNARMYMCVRVYVEGSTLHFSPSSLTTQQVRCTPRRSKSASRRRLVRAAPDLRSDVTAGVPVASRLLDAYTGVLLSFAAASVRVRVLERTERRRRHASEGVREGF